MLNDYDFACAAECAQEFEGLMPKAIEKLGGIGEELKIVDVEALAKGEADEASDDEPAADEPAADEPTDQEPAEGDAE